MDTQDSRPPNLATRLRRANIDTRVAALLEAAVGEELGVDLLHVHDAAAARRLAELVGMAARRTGPCAVNKFAFELLELLDDAPDLRDELARPPSELVHA